MSFFIQSLFIVVPIFFVLIIVEEVASRMIGIQVNRSADLISSLSSGISNITKDAMKLSIVIISYSWFLERLMIYKLDPVAQRGIQSVLCLAAVYIRDRSLWCNINDSRCATWNSCKDLFYYWPYTSVHAILVSYETDQ